ncbi:hypothetical protein [Streptomyces sp. NPDC096311]|uniref:hypothetical protein n=1 Tax=Streptomyces sp. NPDC096311 TaxID=3366083 RepID=UPI00380715A7
MTSGAASADTARGDTHHATLTQLDPDDLTGLEVAINHLGATYVSKPPRELWPTAAAATNCGPKAAVFTNGPSSTTAPSSPCPSANSNAAPAPTPTAGTTCSPSSAPAAPHEHREPVGVTTTPGEREAGQSDTETGFHRAEHLLQIPDNTAVHQTLYGRREDTEAGFSPFDRSLWNRRMIAFGAAAQSLVVLGFLLAQNATSSARYKEDPTYADAGTTDLSADSKPRRS